MEKSVDRKNDDEKRVNNKPSDDLPIKGRFARYISPYLQLMIPLLSTRYLWLAIEDVNPLKLLKKSAPGVRGYLSNNNAFASLGMGSTIFGIIGYYSKRTYDDVRTLYAEAVGYELGKKPEDVDLRDLMKSKNEALGVTREAFVKRTLYRFGAGSAFFIPWKIFSNRKSKYNVSINAGVGAIATYLSLDGFYRSASYFDTLQNLVDISINHADGKPHEIIHSKDIQSLLSLQRKHLNPDYKWPTLNSPGGENETALADRITDLMNQTYDNIRKTEQAHFTVGKFNYLVGFGMLENFPASLAFVELANKSLDMKEVNAAATSINSGQDPQAVFQEFGIDMNNLVRKCGIVMNIPAHGEGAALLDNAPYDKQAVKTHAARYRNGKDAETPFPDRVQPAKDKMPQSARTHQDFAAQITDPHLVNP